MNINLRGKTVLVTGASQGIGRAIALRLAKEGAILALHYFGERDKALELKSEVEAMGGEAALFYADFNIPENAGKLGGVVWEQLGRIDYLINNAGVSYKKHFLDITPADIDFFTNINFKSTLLLTQSVADRMVRGQVKGGIYTITSINGIQPGVGLNVYGATKGALETLMKGIALELAPHHLNVNTIALGAVGTDMNKSVLEDEEKLNLVNAHIPLGRMGEAEEIANVVVGLLQAGTYMTGSTIVIDGGWSLKRGYALPQTYRAE
ncbi:SDR family NAD(P)-dependent oxidoreductase [Pedobacter sp.]